MTERIVFGEMWICPTCGRLTVQRITFRVGVIGRTYCEMCQPNTPLEALFDVVGFAHRQNEETPADVQSTD